MVRQASIAPERPGFGKRFVRPVLLLFLVMVSSWLVYNLSWRLENVGLHRVLASLSGTLLFLSVAFGTLAVYPWVYFKGGSWKECVRLCISFSFFECAYYYANPLNVWLAFGVIAEMGLAELLCRQRLRKGGDPVRVLHPLPVAALSIGLSLVVFLYLWGQGENAYALFLEGYRAFFGPGTGVGVTL